MKYLSCLVLLAFGASAQGASYTVAFRCIEYGTYQECGGGAFAPGCRLVPYGPALRTYSVRGPLRAPYTYVEHGRYGECRLPGPVCHEVGGRTAC